MRVSHGSPIARWPDLMPAAFYSGAPGKRRMNKDHAVTMRSPGDRLPWPDVRISSAPPRKGVSQTYRAHNRQLRDQSRSQEPRS